MNEIVNTSTSAAEAFSDVSRSPRLVVPICGWHHFWFTVEYLNYVDGLPWNVELAVPRLCLSTGEPLLHASWGAALTRVDTPYGNRPSLTVCRCDQIQFPFFSILERFYSITPSPFVMLTQTCSTLSVHRCGGCEQVGTNKNTQQCLFAGAASYLFDRICCPVHSGTEWLRPKGQRWLKYVPVNSFGWAWHMNPEPAGRVAGLPITTN